jgi:hypothetical protein
MLFASFRLPLGVIEEALGRRLKGDPARGERGIVAALNRGRLDAVRKELAGNVGPDFREFVAKHVQKAESLWHAGRVWRVRLRREVWELYAREAQRTGLPLHEGLSAAIERDFRERRQGKDP